MAFTRPATDDTILASHILQIIYAWEGTVGEGEPLDLSEVDSAEYALKAKNKNAASLCFQFLTAAGNPLLRGAGATVYLGQNMEVTAGKTIDGVDVGAHAATTDTHIAATTGMHGATATATANKLLIRDAAGRAKVAAPAVASDVALKSTVDAVQTNLNTHQGNQVAGVHGSTTAATADKLVHRDASGRAQVAAPSAAADIARKDTVDTVQTNLNAHVAMSAPHGATPDPTANRMILRDASGRAAVAAPSVAADIARKSTVDAVQTNLDAHNVSTVGTHGSTLAATPNKLVHRDAAGRAKVVAPSAAEDIALKSTVDAVQTNLTTHKEAALLDHPDNSVDDTKVGDRVPQFYRRQGGHATNWSTGGTTTYTPGMVRMQGGNLQVAEVGTAITFPVAFSDAPLVFLTAEGAGCTAAITGVTAATVSVRTYDASHNPAMLWMMWLAIGPE